MSEQLFPIVLGVAFFVAVAFSAWRAQQRRNKFAAAFAVDDEFECDAGSWGTPSEVRNKRGPLRARLHPREGRSHELGWQLWIERIDLGARTTLSIQRMGFIGAVRAALGDHDIKVGDDSFDAGFVVRGGDADVVKGVFVDTAVRDAVRALFEPGLVRDVRLGSDGVLFVDAVRAGAVIPDEARWLIKASLQLASTLQSSSAAPALASSAPSGAPVAVH